MAVTREVLQASTPVPDTGPGLPLFDRFPALAGSLPHVSFASGPSPVGRLRHLDDHLNGIEVWVKNDGVYGTVYGGNKPRKLEFVLAEALSRGATTILTTGALGTNHGLATALYGKAVGLKVALALTYQQPTAYVAQRLCWMQAAGAELHYTRSILGTLMAMPVLAYRYRRADSSRRWPYVLGPGGSTPRGALGYVNAALELADQVRRGQMPEPAAIIVALGSAGTAAGLLLGLRIAGLDSRLIGVAVTRAPTASTTAVRALSAATARSLRGLGARLDRRREGKAQLSVVRRALGEGYGVASPEGERARELVGKIEGLGLDPTYTAKAVAALFRLAREGGLQGPVLYWHTHNALPSSFLEPTADDVERLPSPLSRICRGAIPISPIDPERSQSHR